MSIAFSAAVYLMVGLVVVTWLRVQAHWKAPGLSQGLAVLFWPAYLPVCLAPAEPPSTQAPTLAQVVERLASLPVDEARRAEYGATVARIERALSEREAELQRLQQVEVRLEGLAASLETAEHDAIVAEELARIRKARAQLNQDVTRARAQVVGLAVRLEVLAVRAPRAPLLDHLTAFEQELDCLLRAQEEVEALGDP